MLSKVGAELAKLHDLVYFECSAKDYTGNKVSKRDKGHRDSKSVTGGCGSVTGVVA